MDLWERVQAIVRRPTATWPVIAGEATDAATLYRAYLAPVAAVPALAGFIGHSLFGGRVWGVTYRTPILQGLVGMVVGYVLSLAVVYVVALIADALAPSFGGTKNPLAALKLVVYGSTAGFLGGLFSLVPALAALGGLAGLYSVYLLYTGAPVLMKVPPDQVLPYTAVLLLAGLIAGGLLSAVGILF